MPLIRSALGSAQGLDLNLTISVSAGFFLSLFRHTDKQSKETDVAKSKKVIITCAVTGSIHTPSMSPHLPITRGDRGSRHRRRKGRRGDRASARPRPEDGRPDQTPEAFAPFLKVIKQASQRGDQHHHRRRRDDDHRAAGEARRDLQAGSRLAQHGHDEFRALPDAGSLQGVQA